MSKYPGSQIVSTIGTIIILLGIFFCLWWTLNPILQKFKLQRLDNRYLAFGFGFMMSGVLLSSWSTFTLSEVTLQLVGLIAGMLLLVLSLDNILPKKIQTGSAISGDILIFILYVTNLFN